MDETHVLGGWVAVAALLVWWARRSARSGTTSWLGSLSAGMSALPHLAVGSVLLLLSSQSMIKDNPDRDMKQRLVFFVTGAGTLLAAASLLHSAWRLLPRRRPAADDTRHDRRA